MAILSSLLAVTEPKGVWITIIKAFEGVTKNYVLAIIFLTVVIRLIWGLVDTLTKFNSQHMSAINSKMQPEIEKIKQKYANQPEVLQQKQNEVYKRYYGKSYYGSCLITFLVMGLNMLIFFTLFSGLNTMSAYKIATNYENIKYTYANCLNVSDKYWNDDRISLDDKKAMFSDYENIKFLIETGDNGEKTVSLIHENGGEEGGYTTLYSTAYKTDFSEEITLPAPEELAEGEEGAEEDGDETTQKISTNTNIIKLIQTYFPVYEEGDEPNSKEIIIGYQDVETEGETTQQPLYLSTALYNAIENRVIEEYDLTQEKFLWIQNIWIADSPLNKSISGFTQLRGQVGKNKFEEGEETIYNAFMPGLKEARNRANGYFILTILIVAASVLSMFITKQYNKRKNAKLGKPTPPAPGGKWMQIILPILLGVFALFYNSVFAIYILTGQVVSMILLLPQLLFVDWVISKREGKKKSAVEVVDYSRKF